MGCTAGQVFRYAVVPSARPNIVLGINQSAIYALGMVVAAALVGSRDLGQTIFIALGRANSGLGITAGLLIALACFALTQESNRLQPSSP
jgi:glycine betaine/proline transport system permease protein